MKRIQNTLAYFLKKLPISQSSLFVVILMATHFINLLFNMFLGKSLSAEDYGLVTFITSLLYFTNIIFLSIVATMSHTVAFLQANAKQKVGRFFSNTRNTGLIYALAVSLLWLLLVPALSSFFHISSSLSLLLYIPIFSLGFLTATNRGLLQGKLQFIKAGIILASEAFCKLAIATTIVALGYHSLAYISIPFSIAFASVVSFILTKNIPSKETAPNYSFPWQFFVNASLASLSTMAFLGIDVILVKHYFTPLLAGQYALLSLTGKTIYFLGSLFNNFLIPLVGRDLGKGRNPVKTFYAVFILSFTAIIFGFIVFGLFGHITAPLIFGVKAHTITELLPRYSLAIVFYTVATSITTYHLAKKEYIFPIISIVNAVVVTLAMTFFNTSLAEIVEVLVYGSMLNVLSVVVMHILFTYFPNTGLLKHFAWYNLLPKEGYEK